MAQTQIDLLYGPDSDISVSEAAVLGLQHVFAMDVYVPPLIIAGLLSLGATPKIGFFTGGLFGLWFRHFGSNRLAVENAYAPRPFLCTCWCSRRRLFS